MPEHPTAAAVVLAGGSGRRVGAASNKVYLPLAGLPVLWWSLQAVHATAGIGPIVLVVRADDEADVHASRDREPPGARVAVVRGGASRHESELAGLRALAPHIRSGSVDVVAIHDGARPLARPELFRVAIETARAVGGAIPALPADDVTPAAPPFGVGGVGGVGALVRVQTPQAFRAAPLLDAYEAATRDGHEGSDTASTVERYADLTVRCVPGDPRNIKITYAQDLALAEQLLADGSDAPRLWWNH